MRRLPLAVLVVVALGMIAQGGRVLAQYQSPYSTPSTPLGRQVTPSGDPKPRTDLGGYTGNEMRSIYRQDVGQGYTSQSLNTIALQNARARVPYVGQSSAGTPTTGPNVSRLGLGVSPSRVSKPFSSVTSAPTVSPYMNLFRNDFGGDNDLNYQTLVRPQLQQQQANQQFQRETQELDRRVQSIAAQSDYKNAAGSEQQYPTGHQTVFMYKGHYYPAEAPHKKRQQ